MQYITVQQTKVPGVGRVNVHGGVWRWVNAYGYSRYAHIALWELWPGQAESNTLYACRDRRCVRVCHLVPGTWSVTSRDCSGTTRQVAALV